MPYGHIGLLIKHHSECPRIAWFSERCAICLWNLNLKLIGQLVRWIMIRTWLGKKGSWGYKNSRKFVSRHMIMRPSTRRSWKEPMMRSFRKKCLNWAVGTPLPVTIEADVRQAHIQIVQTIHRGGSTTQRGSWSVRSGQRKCAQGERTKAENYHGQEEMYKEGSKILMEGAHWNKSNTSCLRR